MKAWSPTAARRGIVVAGCFAMVYTQLTMSPATIQFARSFGATGLQFGILGALPISMLFMQFVSAVVVNHLRYRRRLWFTVSVLQRLMFVPIVVATWLLPGLSDGTWMWSLIVLTAANHALLHFCTPLWLSWMGDYLAHDGLSRFWGIRQLWMQWAGAAALLAGAVFLLGGGLDIRQAFTMLLAVGAVFGLADILLFLKVDEPPVCAVAEPRLREVLAAPFHDKQFRSFISFSSFWHVASMVGAPFINLYLLDFVGMDVFHLLMLWTGSWVGGAIFSGRLGLLVETYGNRPVLILCVAFKSINMLALLLTPANPTIAFWIMLPAFMIDAVLNSGIAIANNGFMIKNSPSENRTMYIAAGTALAGIVGGFASILAGGVLSLLSDFRGVWGPLVVCNYHVVFAVSFLLRLTAAVLVRRVRESESYGAFHVATQLVGVAPIRALRFPVGIYRSFHSRDQQAGDIDESATTSRAA